MSRWNRTEGWWGQLGFSYHPILIASDSVRHAIFRLLLRLAFVFM